MEPYRLHLVVIVEQRENEPIFQVYAKNNY